MTKLPASVALIVDQPDRDLAGMTLCAAELASRGIRTCLVSASDRAREIWALRPDLVLLFNLRRMQEPLVRLMMTAGIAVGLLDTEGGVWPDAQSYAELLFDDASLLRRIRPLCAWSPLLSRYLTEKGIFVEDQFRLTGCPRFDFYRQPWRATAEGKRQGLRHILINTSFPEWNPRFGTHREVMREFLTVHRWAEERIQARIDGQREGMAAMIDIAQRLTNDFPSVPVVVRPHPFEKGDSYRDAFRGLPRVEVNDKGSVQPKMFHALASIQRGSTTAIEAGLAGVPALSPRWAPVSEEVPSSEDVSVQLAAYDDLKQCVAAIVDGTYVVPDNVTRGLAAVIDEWFFRVDGDSYRRVADAVQAHVPASRQVDESACRKLLYGLPTAGGSWARRAPRWIRHKLRLTPDWSFRRFRAASSPAWTRTDQFFDVGRVQEILRGLAAVGPEGFSRVRAVPARESGAYADNYLGYGVVIETPLPSSL